MAKRKPKPWTGKMPENGLKRCRGVCKLFLPLDRFNKNVAAIYNVSNFCKDCISRHLAKRYAEDGPKVKKNWVGELPADGLKECKYCYKKQLLSAFNTAVALLYGVNNKCKQCIKEDYHSKKESKAKRTLEIKLEGKRQQFNSTQEEFDEVWEYIKHGHLV